MYYTASGIITSVGGLPMHGMATYNFDLLMMGTYCSKHVQAYNKIIIKQELVHYVG